MSYELKDGQGSLFRNEQKEAGSKQPDYSGKIMIEGTEYRIAGWVQESKGGKKYFSLKASLPQDAPTTQTQPSNTANDLPF